MQEFQKLLLKDQNKKNHDTLLDELKLAVTESVSKQHKWDTKAMDSLRVIQSNALEDRSVPDKQSWDSAIKFMEKMIQEKLKEINDQIQDFKGPSFKERWFNWKYITPEQLARSATINELEKLNKSFDRLKLSLESDELTAVKKNLQVQKVQVDEEFIKETWTYVYRRIFLQKKMTVCNDCRNFYFYYQKGFTDQGVSTEIYCVTTLIFDNNSLIK
jgi:optic atrophy protein 1